MSAEDTRVLLVKPGDLLLIGNVRHIGDAEQAASAVKVFSDMGIRVVFFMADIDMSKTPDLANHASAWGDPS